jgi:hypothetical protein
MDKALILKGIADNPALMEELKKLLMDEFETPSGEIAYSNERLGEMVKARLIGVGAIEKAFSKILEYKTPGEKVESKHPGR